MTQLHDASRCVSLPDRVSPRPYSASTSYRPFALTWNRDDEHYHAAMLPVSLFLSRAVAQATVSSFDHVCSTEVVRVQLAAQSAQRSASTNEKEQTPPELTQCTVPANTTHASLTQPPPTAPAAPPTAPPSGHAEQQKCWWRACTWALSFCIANFMPLAFLVALILSLAWPAPGKAVASVKVGSVRVVQAVNNAIVFLISGLTLKSDEFRALLRCWVGVLYGVVAILMITPCFAFLMLVIPFQPDEFSVGLAIFCVVPTTLGVGVALTAAAKGNQALALFLTVSTNLLGIITVPYTLKLVLRGSTVLSVDPGNLIVKLIITVLIPTIIGKALREVFPSVARFATKYKTALSLISTTNLALIVWQTLSGAQEVLLQQSAGDITLVILAAVLLHVVFLTINGLMVSNWVLRLPAREAVAVLIMSSQKSAPVAVTVITYITTNLTQQGLFAIPSIVGQLAQIFMGSFLTRALKAYITTQEEE